MGQLQRRKKKLIKPGLQLRLSGGFLGLVLLMLGLQFVLLTSIFQGTANELPNDGALLIGAANGAALRLVGVSALIFLPLTLLVGIVTTFRVAGPLHRFESFLSAVRDGDRPADFHLRDRDELKELAALINEATRPLRTEIVVRDLDDSAHTSASQRETAKRAA
ncbi:MAG: hypothetical protein AAGA20_07765 [Planctomycetota bacterium]